jgi:hypothetical protein
MTATTRKKIYQGLDNVGFIGPENINALHAGDVGLRINPDPFQGDSEDSSAKVMLSPTGATVLSDCRLAAIAT